VKKRDKRVVTRDRYEVLKERKKKLMIRIGGGYKEHKKWYV
jgi:hypothetical protein